MVSHHNKRTLTRDLTSLFNTFFTKENIEARAVIREEYGMTRIYIEGRDLGHKGFSHAETVYMYFDDNAYEFSCVHSYVFIDDLRRNMSEYELSLYKKEAKTKLETYFERALEMVGIKEGTHE